MKSWTLPAKEVIATQKRVLRLLHQYMRRNLDDETLVGAGGGLMTWGRIETARSGSCCFESESGEAMSAIDRLKELAERFNSPSLSISDCRKWGDELESLLPELEAERARLLEPMERLIERIAHEFIRAKGFNESQHYSNCIRCQLEAATREAKEKTNG